VRYAADCNIYVRSRRPGRRVMESIEQFVPKGLKLRANKAKSAVAKPNVRKLLGLSFAAKRILASIPGGTRTVVERNTINGVF
jgi:retron-type reverse transcriptase